MREKDGLVFHSFNSLSVGHLQQRQQEQEKDKREDSRGRRSRRRRDRSRKRGKEMHKEKAKLLDPGLPCACFLPYLEKERERERDATSMSPFFDSKGTFHLDPFSLSHAFFPSLSMNPWRIPCRTSCLALLLPSSSFLSFPPPLLVVLDFHSLLCPLISSLTQIPLPRDWWMNVTKKPDVM